MSQHLPECSERRAEWRHSEDCICNELRACEQRVLDAARKAVAGVGVRKDTSQDMRVQALAAIDALREEKP